MKKSNKLTTYRKKRNFTKSPEPMGKVRRSSPKKPIFVVHEHHASHLHYDLRLEINGVLPSWAIPKGPPLKVGEKRLAVATEDHPLEYATFKGVIPEGSYGAGVVKIWDKGTYENAKEDYGLSMEECLQQGSIEVLFKGKKLKGLYALIRTHFRDTDKNWLFFKIKKKPEATS
jgi:bifunctional non-homologous end joining protein LigD